MINVKILTASLGLLLLALPSGPQAAAGLSLQPFEAVFSLEARGFTVGETLWRVRPSKDGFIYESRTEAVGLAAMFSDKRVVERSEWKLVGDELKPAQYRYERAGRPDKSRLAVFDWNGELVRNTRHGKTTSITVPEDTLDRLGYMLVLMEDLRAGKRSFRYHVADGKNRIKVYRLEVVGEEWMNTALGKVRVLKIVRDRDDDDRETTIWMAPALDFMPVRMEHREGGEDELTIRIRSLSRHSLAGDSESDRTEPGKQLAPFR